MLAAAMTAATTMGAGVNGSTRRHEITAWNSAAHALSHSQSNSLQGRACGDLLRPPNMPCSL